MSLRNARALHLVLTAAVIAALAIVFWRPFGNGARTDPEIERLARHCEEELSQLAEADVFAGAEIDGSPEHVLAMFTKWASLDPLDWIAERADMRMVITYGDDFDNCYRLDKRGFVIATHFRHKSVETSRWVRRHNEDGRIAITQFERDSAVRNGEAAAWFTLGVNIGSREVTRLQLAGQAAGTRSVEGSYAFDATTGQLEIRVGQEEKAVMASDGRLVASHYRSCFEPDEPCDEPWETTRYTFDAAGNPTDRRTEFGGDEQHDQLVLTLNARGDWVAWRFASAPEESQATRRAIIYRD